MRGEEKIFINHRLIIILSIEKGAIVFSKMCFCVCLYWALPLVILYSPPVRVGAFNKDVLLVFVKGQVIVSERCVVLQGDNLHLSCISQSHLAKIKKSNKRNCIYLPKKNKMLYSSDTDKTRSRPNTP